MVRHNVPMMVPSLFYLEVINVLEMMQLRQRMDAEQVERALQLLERLPVTVDAEATLFPTALRIRALMRQFRLTAYDAAYLELAQRRHLRLSTLDKSLQGASEELQMFFAL